jgi:hypothetical protein
VRRETSLHLARRRRRLACPGALFRLYDIQSVAIWQERLVSTQLNSRKVIADRQGIGLGQSLSACVEFYSALLLRAF